MLTDTVGQEFGWSTVRTAGLCSVMSGASEGGLKGWELELSESILAHVWCFGGSWLLSTLTSPYKLAYASSQHGS